MSVCLRLSFLAMVISLSIISFIPSQQAADPDVAIYWGQNNNEPSLDYICSSGYYNYVMISYLIIHSQSHIPTLNLAGHCNPEIPGDCFKVGEQIKYCQDLKVKVFLSLLVNADGSKGDDVEPISSTEYATWLANYIWNHYLGGQSSDRPFGDAVLDGVDFEDETPESGLTWKDLTIAIHSLSVETGTKIYIAVSPQCPTGDNILQPAIETGFVDYAWVRFFYHNPSCVYNNGNIDGILTSWSYWSELMGNNKLLMGVPSSDSMEGYIPPDVLITKILPIIEKSPSYGGIMVWTNFGPDPYTPVIKSNSYIKLYPVE